MAVSGKMPYKPVSENRAPLAGGESACRRIRRVCVREPAGRNYSSPARLPDVIRHRAQSKVEPRHCRLYRISVFVGDLGGFFISV